MPKGRDYRLSRAFSISSMPSPPLVTSSSCLIFSRLAVTSCSDFVSTSSLSVTPGRLRSFGSLSPYAWSASLIYVRIFDF